MDTEGDGNDSGSVFGPHIESSDSEVSDNETHVHDTENLGSDDDFEQMTTMCNNSEWTDVEKPEITRVDVNSVTFLTRKCDESKTPHLNQHFHTIEDAFIFYKEYGRICGFDVRYSSKKSNSRDKNKGKSIDSTPHRAERFVSPLANSEVIVHNPNVSRNKGCGSRIKSSRELSMGDKKKRKCSNCSQLVHHNARTCPEPKKHSEP